MWNFFKSATAVQNISAAEVKEMLDSNANFILLDVRTPEEYRRRHIPKSRLLPLDRLEKEVNEILPDPSVRIVTYCQTGGRSTMAAKKLSQVGYQNVSNLGGINSWPYETE